MLRSLLVAHALCFAPIALAAESPLTVPLTTPDGKETRLARHAGKAATIVVFVSFECPVSNAYAAPLNELAKQHADQGAAVVLVCPTDEKPEAVAKAAAGFKLTVPVLLDPKKELAAALKAEITPEAFVLNAGGTVLYRGRIDDGYSARLKKNPAVTSHDLRDALASVLANKSVKTTTTKAVGCPIDFDTAPRSGAITFHKHVAPILNAQCVICHRAGEIGPFALTSYAQAKRWAADIKEYTASRQMPPWMPTDGVPLKGARKLTKDEIATLAAWADAGAPEGDPKDAPKSPEFGDGWRHGKPDLIVGAGEDFILGPSGNDLFRCFVAPTGLKEDKWIVGYDVKPGNPRIVHHTLHFFDTSGQGRAMEKAQREKDRLRTLDTGPGYTSAMGVGFVPAPSAPGEPPKFGGLGGWAPGQTPHFVPAGAGRLLPKGSDFIIQTHYHRDGKVSSDRTQVGLYFAKGPVEQPWQTLIVNGLKAWEKIPAGRADYTARGSVYIHSDAVLYDVLPHMHRRGKSVTVTMTPPGEKPVVLVHIPAWDYNWQETYWFEKPIHAKAGTRLEVVATFDNSAANPNNPTRPPREVSYGEETDDEMLFVFFGATSTTKPHTPIKTYAFPPNSPTATGPVAGQLTPLLESLVGTWDTSTNLKVGARTINLKGKDVAETTFGGKYVRALATSSADERGVVFLMTFDPAAKRYRLWMYDSLGTEVAWTGVHDEKANEINWTATVADGVPGQMKWKLAPTGYTWELAFGPRDKPMLEMSGEHLTKQK